MAKGAVAQTSAHGMTWIDIEEPDARTLEKIQREIAILPFEIEDILSPAQRPKVVRRPNYLFIVFRFPQLRVNARRVKPTELDVILTHDRLITFHGKDLRLVRSLLSDAKLFTGKRTRFMQQGPDHLLFALVRQIISGVFSLTDEVSRQLDALEAQVFTHELHNQDVIFGISNLRRRIIDYRKIAKPQSNFLQQLKVGISDFLPDADQSYWRPVIEIADTQAELLDTYMETIVGLADTNNTLVSHRLNQIFRLLTIISVIFLPASLFLEIVSTNTPGTPLAQLEHSFIIIIGALVVVELVFLWFLRRRRVI